MDVLCDIMFHVSRSRVEHVLALVPELEKSKRRLERRVHLTTPTITHHDYENWILQGTQRPC
jgi:hypothetical protein